MLPRENVPDKIGNQRLNINAVQLDNELVAAFRERRNLPATCVGFERPHAGAPRRHIQDAVVLVVDQRVWTVFELLVREGCPGGAIRFIGDLQRSVLIERTAGPEVIAISADRRRCLRAH